MKSDEMVFSNLSGKDICRILYKTREGKPFELTDGQNEIFEAIFKRKYPRLHIETCTQYGKSETISMAVLTRLCLFPEQWAVISHTKDKAQIIMNYLIGHIFDNDFTRSRFVMEKGETEESIRRYKNKSKINLKLENGLLGEIFIGTAKDAMGLGSPNVVEDESALIKDPEEALVFRMLNAQPDNFYCKVGNPWDSGHFRKTRNDLKYHKIRVIWQQAVKEGRLTFEQVEEARQRPFFKVLFDCEFPDMSLADEKGWVSLLTEDEINNAIVDIDESQGFGLRRLGVDVAGGGRNFSVLVHRTTNLAKILFRLSTKSTMNLLDVILTQKNERGYRSQDIFIDALGVGKGPYDSLVRVLNIEEEDNDVWPTAVIGSEKADDDEKFINKRAECYWRLREWILGGGQLVKNDYWLELTKIKYRVSTDLKRGRLQIMSKEDMLKLGVESPDCADALALTFARPDNLQSDEQEVQIFRPGQRGNLDEEDSTKSYRVW